MSDATKRMPITDDHGHALTPQYRVIAKRLNWTLLYDQMQVGEKMRHEFRIIKQAHDVLLYPGISITDAMRRFNEMVDNDYE